ncbi:MAG TPA: Smr/MutS family protein, partial [Gemmatimonadaceae bacterium]|nr:Smr/MutS family protein [Gemmatimonadaceae bacterium]
AVIDEDVRARAKRVAEREGNVRERERNAERDARREARRLLLDARAEVDRTIRELKESAAADEAAREARRRMEQLAAAEGEAISALEVEERQPMETRAPPQGEVAPGSYVSLATLGGRTARVVEFRDGDAIVAVGSVKMTVPKASLSPANAPEGERIQIAIRGDAPEINAKSEIDLRGLRAAEIEDVVMQAVDSAVRADLKSLRIIHGKGTGALRERVAEMLRKESRVASFRLGAWNEGGAGVTVAELA